LAESGEVDVDGLELLVAIAGAVVEERPVAPVRVVPVDGLVNITPVAAAPLQAAPVELHLRAQRFARVQVAEIRLYQSEIVKKGRAAHDVYTSLKEEIDSAREAFRCEFLNASDSMVDYLHLDLVRTLANDDAEVLGKDYPGPMV